MTKGHREAKGRNSKRIVIYNHKGGVGKTTLTINIAFALAHLGKNVLLLDSDPQCNITSYLIDDVTLDDLLDNSDKENGQTLWSSIKPIVDGTGDARTVEPIRRSKGLSLIPGDIRMSEFETALNDLWTECFQRRIRGFRGVTALSCLINEVCEDNNIDFVFYDCGPNIGSLNKVILLDCDYFIVPAACDLFSVRALKTLGHTLVSWTKDWQTIAKLAPDDTYLLSGKPKFLGYIPQRFRIYRDLPSSSYAPYLPKIERTINSEIVSYFKKDDPDLVARPMREHKIGEVKDFGTLASAGQSEGLPLWEVSAGSPAQKENAREAFNSIALKIVALVRASQ
jgi:cellulose biosynthesis protein BcsQ